MATAALLGITAAAGATPPADCKNVYTENGPVNGLADAKTGVCAFKGIPYAAPPVGKLRFTPPQPHEKWSQPLDTVKYGNICTQFPMSLTPVKKPSGSEDCLYLNVWYPANSEGGKPVMFFIHGGGFVNGSANESFYEGTRLASKGDLVVVTINYRLNLFGFLTHPALKDKDGHEGNYGMLDQIAALKWVKKNIANFGGDPENVTIFGESAGGISVGLLLLSPLADGLFNRAIIESGPALLFGKTAKEDEKTGLDIASRIGCPDPATAAECLRNVDPIESVQAARIIGPGMLVSTKEGGIPIGPVTDGWFLPDKPLNLLRDGKLNRTSGIMAGSNRNEGSLFILKKNIANKDDAWANYTDDTGKLRDALGFEFYDQKLLDMYLADTSYQTPKKAYEDLIADLMFTCPNRIYAKLALAKQPDIYVYNFAVNLANKDLLKKVEMFSPDLKKQFADLGAFHGAELPFVFGNFNYNGLDLTTKINTEISNRVIELWSSFARNGVPAASGAPEWPKFNAGTTPFMIIDSESKPAEKVKTDQCAIIEKMLTRN